MTDSANSSQFWPGEVIAQATDIIGERFKLDAAQSLAVLRGISRNTRTQMCVVAEQVINRELPVEAVDVVTLHRPGPPGSWDSSRSQESWDSSRSQNS
ncbi:hypothetical protein A5709_11325 [Mycobacterium sp. E1386]|uniref:ANTAR domain-containing protein n=1 Tax=Mycobacterium sp. E1386 TaxID=1834126 RepID=UPI000801428F|nr:ANTAR domain-containing protein [Mycobacterium sp. E1386]OBI39411.1 hypothetical protein A5709_11325 [Mycobacterium sp. E1386]